MGLLSSKISEKLLSQLFTLILGQQVRLVERL